MASEMAEEVFNRNFDDAHIVDFYERLDHDGHDRYGPKSNIWDLHMIVLENDVYMYYYFHCEDWYSRTNIRYDLEYKASVETIHNADNDKDATAFYKTYITSMGLEDEDYCKFMVSLTKEG